MEKVRILPSAIRKIISRHTLLALYDRVFCRTANRSEIISFSDAIREVYKGVLGRDVDRSGYTLFLERLKAGTPLSAVISDLINSSEFTTKRGVIPHRSEIPFPDLTKVYPNKYCRFGPGFSVFAASSEDDFAFLESLMMEYRYYDSIESYSSTIDLDKVVTASIVNGLKAKSAIELGCFTGPVISLLAGFGLEVCGVEISHLAFVLAYDNIRDKIVYGDLLDLNLQSSYDAFIAMDVLEHLNPFRIDRYVEKIQHLVNVDGFVLLNVPMFGNDDIFGTVFNIYFPEWQEAGDHNFWRHIHCDAKGWPIHGHLTLASPKWWEKVFGQHGLVRDRSIETEIQGFLKPFFDKHAPARRSLFVLRHEDSVPDHTMIRQSLRESLLPVVAEIELSASSACDVDPA